MNPVQKQLLGLGAAVMLAMLIFPPWTRISHHVVMETDRNRSVAETETQQFAGYSLLFDPPKTRSLNNPQILLPGDYYESVQIDFDLFLLQWLTLAFVTATGLLYFKSSDKVSLQEWWSSLISAKSRPTTNPPKPPPLDSINSEGQARRMDPPRKPVETHSPQIVVGIIRMFCPHCGQSLQCDESHRGKQIRCPPCGQLFLVPMQNDTNSVESIKARADGGDAKAQNELGVLYEKGQGVSQDYLESLKWYHKAAEQGFAGAQCNLGRMFNLGGDYDKGLKWITKAANQGNAHAQGVLGVMYSLAAC